jgi:tripartite-type tricarboxylate transporter receptor subunit TctC
MNIVRSRIFIPAVACWGLVWASSSAVAQVYPAKSIRVVVPFAPGGATDITARTVGAKLSEALKQSVVVDNRSGGGGVIGADLVAKAPADGYTVLIGTPAETAILPHMQRMPYDALRDFAPVSLATSSPLILVVHPSLPVKSVKELIALIRARPGQLSYGSAGAGGVHHLAGELLKATYKLDMVHVPYKGRGCRHSRPPRRPHPDDVLQHAAVDALRQDGEAAGARDCIQHTIARRSGGADDE